MLASISAAITAAVQRVSRRLSMQYSSEIFGGNLHSIPASISATITTAFQQAFRRQFTQHFSEHFGGSYWSILVSIRWRSMEDLMRYFSGNLWPGLYDAKSSAYVKMWCGLHSVLQIRKIIRRLVQRYCGGCCRYISGSSWKDMQRYCRDLADNCQTVLAEMMQKYGRDVAYYFRPCLQR